MANARKNSIHHQIMRRASRSEYNDGLLRHNQRYENRLLLELEQWEKAQRLVAKGLDRESQWFKQNASSTSYNPQRSLKRNSLTELSLDPYSGPSHLVPDYQYRNRATIMAEKHPYDHDNKKPLNTLETDGERKHTDHGERKLTDHGERKHTDQTDSPSKTHHKKHSRKEDLNDKKGISKDDGSHRKSSKQQAEREARDREGEKQDADKPASGSSPPEKKTSKTATEAKSATEASPTTPHKLISTQGASDKPAQKKTSTKSTRKCGVDHIFFPSNITTTSTTSTTTTTTTCSSSSMTAATTQTVTDATKSESPSKTPAVPITPRPFNITEDVHDPGDINVSSKLMRDLGWDGRRRYTNVWDNLSAPKHPSNVRSVRSRLQREFTQLPASDGSNRKGTASARRSVRTSALT